MAFRSRTVHPVTRFLLIGIASALLVFNCQASAQKAEWLQFRGAGFNPTASNPKLPTRWSTTENVEWSTEIPGRGWSSPIVTGGKVFLTTVTTDGESKLPQTGTEFSNEYVAELMKQGLSQEEVIKRVNDRDIEMPGEVNLHYFLYCLDLETGKPIWKKEFHSGRPPGGRHRKNSFCSETPVTDGQHVYVYVANLGLFAYDLQGKPIWTTKLEALPIYLEFGTGSSPVLCDHRLIIVHDNEKQGFVAAFDKSNGKKIWKTEREPAESSTAQAPKSGWVTPFVWRTEDRNEIVTMSPGVAISYDLAGKEIWRLKGVSMAPAASSFEYGGLLYVNGGKTRPIFAVRPGARGDISPGADGRPNERVVWTRPKMGTYIPSPVAYRGGLYVVRDNGIVTRLDAKTGEKTFQARLKTLGADFSSSAWAYNGKVFFLSEQGDTYVIEDNREYKLVGVNRLGEMALATPAIVGDRLLIRTEKRLFSIRQKNE